jgi:hypothetical protein
MLTSQGQTYGQDIQQEWEMTKNTLVSVEKSQTNALFGKHKILHHQGR